MEASRSLNLEEKSSMPIGKHHGGILKLYQACPFLRRQQIKRYLSAPLADTVDADAQNYGLGRWKAWKSSEPAANIRLWMATTTGKLNSKTGDRIVSSFRLFCCTRALPAQICEKIYENRR